MIISIIRESNNHFIKGSMKNKYVFSVIIFVLVVLINIPMFAQNPVFIPDTLSGDSINLSLQHGTVNFYPGQSTNTMGANGNILGPTLILNKYQNVTINVNNQLMHTTTIHWHGLHVSPQNDGGPHIFIQPGEVWSPSFTVLDWASTYWYHPHLHHHTNEHVSKGISGFIIVRDSIESNIILPRTYGVDDFPLAIQTKSFDANNQIIIENALDTTLMVNATMNPYLDLPAQVIRLRLLNGSSERSFNLGFNNNKTFFQIASDGGLLSAPVQLTRLLLAPGERAEILVDFGSNIGQIFQLMNYGLEIPNGIYGATQPGIMAGQTIPGYNLNPLNGSNFSVLQLNVIQSTSDPVTTIPSALLNHNVWTASEADTIRNLTFSGPMGPGAILGPFMINGAFFDMEVINEFVPFNNIEIWELRNQTPIAHPFHIHNVQFYILDINGVPPPANMRGRKDVVLVRGGNTVVRFITKFETFYDDVFPYMYHCHMLTHEDGGMMGQFIVESPFPIPVELISFDASVIDNSVVLKWSTASEHNNYGFEIERKSMLSDFEVIGFVNGYGTTSERKNYSFTDQNISSGNYFYRLKQVDLDGNFRYGNEINVEFNIPRDFILEQNHPNPFNPSTKIKFDLPQNTMVELKVYNTIGQFITTLVNEEKPAGTYEVDFNAADLPSGVYMYRIKALDYVQTRKMLLIK